ncbi:hypothetical protein ACOSQ2_022387 [Xanthoceras sorbifolium]
MVLCYWGKWEDAQVLIVEVMDQDRCVQPNVVTFNVIIDELCKNENIDTTNELLELMIKRYMSPNTITYNMLIDSFCLVGRIDDAMELFVSVINKSCRHDVFSYSIYYYQWLLQAS